MTPVKEMNSSAWMGYYLGQVDQQHDIQDPREA